MAPPLKLFCSREKGRNRVELEELGTEETSWYSKWLGIGSRKKVGGNELKHSGHLIGRKEMEIEIQ
jgi:hypothetical protein